MSAFHDNMLLGASGAGGGYQIERSLRFNSSDSAYLNRTPASAGNRRKFTCSAWVKRTGILASLVDVPLLSAGDGTSFGISGTGALGATYDGRFYIRNGGANLCKIPNALFRDPSAWYHFVFVVDTENATAVDRQILYVNGVRQENFDGSFTQNTDTNINTATVHTIGVAIVTTANSSYSGNFLLAEYHFIDGQALTPSSFGETDTITGVWKPKKYDGTYGTNGFYLNFSDNSGTTSTTLGKDNSGNGNNWTPNNFSVAPGAGNDSMIDTPTPYADGGNGRGNYCTLNPLDRHGALFYNGNLDFYMYGQYGGMQCSGNWGMTTGKWYWECTMTDLSSFAYYPLNFRTGMCVTGSLGIPTYSISEYWNMSGGVGTGYGTVIANGFSYTTGDILQLAFDQSSGKLWFGKNGTWSNAGNPAAGTGANIENIPTSILFSPAVDHQIQINYSLGSFNFGQRPFAYTPPSGFLALNTQNLPEPTIKKPSSYMDVVTYTGNGSTQTIGGLGFSPDFVWAKNRAIVSSHGIYDAVRGATATLTSHSTSAEFTRSGLTAFTSTGFSVGSDPDLNGNGNGIVAWCWDESATPGFDIVTYTGDGVAGRTVSHSLGVAPKMIIVKRRDSTADWPVWHQQVAATGPDRVLFLNATDAQTSAGTNFNNQSGTSSVFYVGTNPATNASGGTYVAYLWSEVAGFSKFGSYTGNGSADGPFVYCGFRPRWIMVKSSTDAGGWTMMDTSRIGYNASNYTLYADLSVVEQGYLPADILSNGFKLRLISTGSSFNTSGQTYIFAAFAESPQKYSLAR